MFWIAHVLAAVPADPPSSPADAWIWGTREAPPSQAARRLSWLVSELVRAADSGCPSVAVSDTSMFIDEWTGGCVTDNGYTVEVTGTGTVTPDDLGSDTTDIDLVELQIMGEGDGTWPTGEFHIRRVLNGPDGDWAVVAEWSGVVDPVISEAGSVEALERAGSCVDPQESYTATWQGTEISASWVHISAPYTAGHSEQTRIITPTWSIEVTTELCGTTWATLGGVTSAVDEDGWGPRVITDSDGDGCALEDCDCDDGDPTIRPGVVDPPDDGVDLDCDTVDGNYWDSECGFRLAEGACADALDTASDGAAPPVTTATRSATPDGCGCAAGAGGSPAAGWLAAAWMRRRRRPTLPRA